MAAADSQAAGIPGAAEASVDSSGSAPDLAGTVVAALSAILPGLVSQVTNRGDAN